MSSPNLHWRGIFDSLTMPVLVVHRSGRVHHANPAAGQFWHLPPERLGGHTLRQLFGQDSPVEAHLRRAIELDPYSAQSYNSLGLAHLEAGERAEAEKAFRRGIAADPLETGNHLNLGSLLFQQENYEEARREFARALEADPGNLTARNNLGLALLALGRMAEGKWQFEVVLESGDAEDKIVARHALKVIQKSGR